MPYQMGRYVRVVGGWLVGGWHVLGLADGVGMSGQQALCVTAKLMMAKG